MAVQNADTQTQERLLYTSAVYTHLCPFRAHTLQLASQYPLVRLLSGGKPGNSGWHGFHNYVPGCQTFILINFSYKGEEGKFKHTVCFTKLANLSHEGMERYLGFELMAQNLVMETCELVIKTQLDTVPEEVV